MAYFCRQAEGFDIEDSLKIVDAEIVDKYVVYVILLKSGRHSWTVRRRYSEFRKLHDELGSLLPHTAKLPPKRLVGNLSDSVIKERKLLLENYLHTLLLHLEDVPKYLSNFLSFDRYEIEGVTKKASEQMFDLAEQMLSSNQPWQICPLLLHSVSSRRRLPAPKSFDKRSDMGHLMDFASQVKKVRILGGLTPIGKSNIKEEELNVDLSILHSLKALELDTVKGRISGVEVIKQSLESVICRRTISHLSDIFIADSTNKTIWNKLTRSDLSYNGLTRIDESTSLLLSLQKLNLSHNRLTSIDNLHHLSALDELNLSHNQIADLPSDMRAKIGNVTVLNLATTGLRCLAPLAKLFSLKDLNVSDNLVARVDDVRPIAGLPCLEKLQLKRNPLTAELDYRFRLLELLSPREKEVQVDGIFPSVQEIDTVAVRLAMTKAKIARQSSEINLVQKERGIPDGADASIPRTLPDVSNSNFVELLLTRIPNPIAGESLVSVIWTPIVLPTAPLDTLPAVVAVSTHSLHILRARGSPGPLCHVEHLLHIPLTKISITYRHKVWVRFEDNGVPTSVAFRMIEDLITTVQAVNRECKVVLVPDTVLLNSLSEEGSAPPVNFNFKAAAKVNNSSETSTIAVSTQRVIYTLTENLFAQKLSYKVNSVFSFKDNYKLFLSESERGDNVLTNFCLLIDTNSEANIHIRFVSYRDRRDFYLALANAEQTSNVYEMVDDKESVDNEEEEISDSDNDNANDLEAAAKKQISPVGSFQLNSVDVNNTSNNTQKDYEESAEGATCSMQNPEEKQSQKENNMSSNIIVLDEDKDVESIENSSSTSSEEFSIYDQYNN